MIILVVNNSEGNSYKKIKLLLSKYLPKISNKTFFGKISQIGLDILVQEIRNVALKDTSVQFYKNTKNKIKLFKTIGNLNNLEHGIFLSKERKIIDLKTKITLNIKENLLRNITILAGLFHDFGKNTIKFQEKLRKNSTNNIDYIRHELISFLILKNIESELFNTIKEKNVSIKKSSFSSQLFFESLSNKENLIKIFKNLNLNTLILKMKEDNSYISNNYSFQDKDFNDSNLLKNSLFWLVLTHHKLSDDKITNNNCITSHIFDELNLNNLFNELEFSKVNLTKNLKISDNNEFIVIELLDKISDISKLILEDINNLDCPISELFYYVVYLCRPVLIISDYMGSNDKEISYDNSLVLANTKNNLPADRLSTHLIKVANYCNQNFKLYLYNIFKSNDLQTLSLQNTTELIKNNLGVEENSFLGKSESFRWQQDCVNKILTRNNNYPTFSVLISETGSGKTRAIPKIISALNPTKIRYNVLIGLKSLVEQTFNEYGDLGLKNNISVLIGGELNKIQKENFCLDGVFNDINKDYNFELLKSENIVFNRNNSFFNQKEKNILQKPIVIATIDHFINHGSLNRGSSTNLFLRSISSDLVLDEIDNYNSEQLILISRLVFLAGLYGKNVIISSATTNSIVSKNLFESYLLGLNKFYDLKKSGNRFYNYLLVSNYLDATNIFTELVTDDSKFNSNYENFINIHSLNLDNKIQKHHLNICQIENHDSSYLKIYNECLLKHNLNYELSKEQKKVSIGFVKFNLIENTNGFSKFLSEINHDLIDVFIFCYHSKFTINDKNPNEKILNLLQRKKKSLDEIQYFKDIISNSSKKEVLFIVSTSSIIEVGRDQDYDWAIIEPSSTSSIIQATGRVRRHRNIKYLKNNICILSKPIFDDKYYGFYKTILKQKTILNNYNDVIFTKSKLDINLKSKEIIDINVENIIGGIITENKISNKYSILNNSEYNYNILTSCENISLDINLNNSDFYNYLSQIDFINKNKTCLMSNKFVSFLKFRKNFKQVIEFKDNKFIDPIDKRELQNIKFIYEDNKKFFINNFLFKKTDLPAYNQIDLSNDDNYNLIYSNIYGLITNKKIKLHLT